MIAHAQLEREMHAWARRLRKRFPTRAPVLVQVKPFKGHVGWCSSFCNGLDGHLIEIRSPWPTRLQDAVDTLCHEWAHALQAERSPRGDDHSDAWGVFNARIYRWAIKQPDAPRAWRAPARGPAQTAGTRARARRRTSRGS